MCKLIVKACMHACWRATGCHSQTVRALVHRCRGKGSSERLKELADMLRLAFSTAEPARQGARPSCKGYRVHVHKERSKSAPSSPCLPPTAAFNVACSGSEPRHQASLSWPLRARCICQCQHLARTGREGHPWRIWRLPEWTTQQTGHRSVAP